MNRSVPAFSTTQKKQLLALGLLDEQVGELQRRLPQIKFLLEPGQTVTELRKKWAAIGRPLSQARREIARLSRSQDYGCAEARFRLSDASENESLLEDALAAISDVESAIEAAKVKLPKQRRRNSASSFPISLIERALLDGFTRHHVAPMPPYLIRTSRSGVFADVVRICYQAVGRNVDPERAIRNYVSEKSLRELLSRRTAFGGMLGSLSLDFLTKRRPGRPRGSKNPR